LKLTQKSFDDEEALPKLKKLFDTNK